MSRVSHVSDMAGGGPVFALLELRGRATLSSLVRRLVAHTSREHLTSVVAPDLCCCT